MAKNGTSGKGASKRKPLSWGILASRRGGQGKTVTLGPGDLEDPEWINFNVGGGGVLDVRYRRRAAGGEVQVRVGGSEYVVANFPDRTKVRLRKRPIRTQA